jgi:hypothetical protein
MHCPAGGPDFRAYEASPLVKEGEVALVELLDHVVPGAGRVDVGLQSVFRSERRREIGVGDLRPRAQPPCHPQLHEHVLGEDDGDRRSVVVDH